MAIRSRGEAGNCRLGAELAASAVFHGGQSTPAAAVTADFARNCLRVVSAKVSGASLAESESWRYKSGARQQAKWNELLQTELQCNRQMHRHGFAIQHCRLILPLAERIHRGLMEQRRAGDNLHGRHPAIGVDQGVHANVSGDALGLGDSRINRRYRADQLCGLDVTAYGKRRFGSRWLFCVSTREPG